MKILFYRNESLNIRIKSRLFSEIKENKEHANKTEKITKVIPLRDLSVYLPSDGVLTSRGDGFEQ